MMSKLVSFVLVTCLGAGLSLSQDRDVRRPFGDKAPAGSEAQPRRTLAEKGFVSEAQKPVEEVRATVRQARPAVAVRGRRTEQVSAPERQTLAYRLKNAPAVDVAKTLERFLEAERRIAGGDDKPSVVVTPESISNTLLICAPAEQIKQLQTWLEEVDRRPPTVVIRAVIGQVSSGQGGEDDGHGTPAGAGDGQADDAGQSIAALKKELGLDALDDPVSEASVKELIGDLTESGRLEILGRPEIRTLDNQAAFIQVGKRAPQIVATQRAGDAKVNQIEMQNVGLILGVTPRVSGDDMVVMEIDFEMSELSQSDDVVLSAVGDDPAVRAPEIVVTTAQSTVAARDGQTVVLGGMATQVESRRTTLLMLVTAHIVPGDAEKAGK
jgi:type II secretory pathway component GspD/PulD (secretin)